MRALKRYTRTICGFDVDEVWYKFTNNGKAYCAYEIYNHQGCQLLTSYKTLDDAIKWCMEHKESAKLKTALDKVSDLW